ncbi:hypothetical protein FA15DRAFT_705062 [Coprinopsis marcescibilis]|uniref:Fungal-type protein kinase domain-containing protein n=1 Tax=Coprinopsis marcescibilis TaxID=230819 RepID=A0A5C3KTM3_COPMA|nr:hypothetical protein FA15DRAFT_705062 [Coprinopsis marcescibilis]
MAGRMDSSQSSALSSPSGSHAFTAYELLSKPTNHQKYLHDLEAFLYVFVWVAVHYDPKTWTRRDNPRSLATWNSRVPEEVAEWKMKVFFANLPSPTVDGKIEKEYESRNVKDLIDLDMFMAAIGEKS